MKLNTSNTIHFKTDVNSLFFVLIPFNVIHVRYFNVKLIHSEHILCPFATNIISEPSHSNQG